MASNEVYRKVCSLNMIRVKSSEYTFVWPNLLPIARMLG